MIRFPPERGIIQLLIEFLLAASARLAGAGDLTGFYVILLTLFPFADVMTEPDMQRTSLISLAALALLGLELTCA
jgi:hypothetical protein